VSSEQRGVKNIERWWGDYKIFLQEDGARAALSLTRVEYFPL
jgi:hypothetical protein